MTILEKFSALLLAVFVFLPAIASAHQPRITESRLTEVPSPEVSKAYYAKLTGEPDVYVINTNEPIDLYVGILVPDIEGQSKDVSAAIIRNGDIEKPLAVLDGINFKWSKFFEEFGRDTYWKGPEYKARVGAGTYEIRVWSSNNDSLYSLAVGQIESFNPSEIISAYTTIPQIKNFFFNKPAYTAFLTPFLGVPIAILLGTLLFTGIWFWRKKYKTI